jgi:class 3 adenylate cyclase
MSFSTENDGGKFAPDESQYLADANLDMLFVQRADDDGTATLDALVDVLAACGVQADDVMVDAVVDGRPITIDVAREVAHALQVEDASEESDVGAEGVRVVPITFTDYVVHVLTCQSTPEGVEYDVAGPQFTPKPRHVIITLLCCVTVLCCALMLLTTSLLWIDHAEAKEIHATEVLGTTTASFFAQFEQNMIKANGLTLNGTAARCAQLFDVHFAVRADELRGVLLRRSAGRGVGAQRAGELRVAALLNSTTRALSHLASIEKERFAATASINTAALGATVAHLNLLLSPAAVTAWSSSASATLNGSAVPCSGSACLAAAPCLVNASVAYSVSSINRTTVGGGTAVARAVTFSAPGGNTIVLCATLSLEAYIGIGQAAAATALSQIVAATLPQAVPTEVAAAVASPLTSSASPLVSWITPLTYQAAGCHASGTCRHQDAAANVALRTRHDIATPIATDRTGVPSIVGVHSTRFDVAIVETVHQSELRTWVLDFYNKPQIKHLNYQRIQLQGSTQEAVMMIHNVSTGTVSEAFQGIFTTCFGACVRPSQAFANAVRGFEEKTGGWSITPDYRPEAVVGGYRYAVEGILDIVIIFERDVVEIRRLALEVLTGMVDTVNAHRTNSLEIIIVGRKHELRTKTFLPGSTCGANVACISSPGYGVVYRSDCSHCTRHVDSPTREIEFISTLMAPPPCQAPGNCSWAHLENDHSGIADHLVFDRATLPRVFRDAHDYRGVKVHAYGGYVANFSVSFVVQHDTAEGTDGIFSALLISTATCVAVIIILILLFVVAAHRLLDKIELEWTNYNVLIRTERRTFCESLRDVMPFAVAERTIEDLPALNEERSVAVAAIELQRSPSQGEPLDASRFATYVQHAIEIFAIHHGVHRLSTQGDSIVFVAGLPAPASAEAVDEEPCFMLLKFLSNIFQLVGSRYAHYQQRCRLVNTAFPGEFVFPSKDPVVTQDVGTIAMPRMRAGVNYGAANVIMQHYATGLPHYDVIGSTVSVAFRLVQAALPSAVLASETVKEKLDGVTVTVARKRLKAVQFSRAQKMAVRGRRLVTAYYVASSLVPIPPQLLRALGVRYARKRSHFNPDDIKNMDDSQKTGTSTLQSRGRSSRSGTASVRSDAPSVRSDAPSGVF